MNRTSKNILIVAGETSGEEHAAHLVNALKQRLGPDTHFFGSGGNAMEQEGVELFHDVSQLAAIGPIAAVLNLGSYIKLFRKILKEVDRRRPELAILVDFPDFNLPLAAKLKARDIPVCYFIGPQVWAWRQSRVKHIRRNIDLMLVILPFEKEFYETHGIEAHYIGNPSATRFRKQLESLNGPVQESDTKIVALLPGSRKKEVEQILPIQMEAARFISEQKPVHCVLVKAPAVDSNFLSKSVDEWKKENGSDLGVEIRENSWEVFSEATCAVVKSGTSTLEAMLASVPFAMVYKISNGSYFLLKPFVKTQTYCLSNLVAGSSVVPEFIQSEAKGEVVGEYLLGLLNDTAAYDQVKAELKSSAKKLGELDAGQEGARIIQEKFFSRGKS